jgi:hypothetical protein
VITSTVWSPAAVPETGVSFYGRLGGAISFPMRPSSSFCPEGGTACLQAARTSSEVRFLIRTRWKLRAPLSARAVSRWQVYVRTAGVTPTAFFCLLRVCDPSGRLSIAGQLSSPTVPSRVLTPLFTRASSMEPTLKHSGTRVYFCRSGAEQMPASSNT